MTLLPLDLPRSALLLVDPQRDYLEASGGWATHGPGGPTGPATGALVETWRRLISAMHAAGRPVIFAVTEVRADRADWALPARYRDLPKDFLVQGSWGAELVDGLRIEPQDILVVKKGLSAFQHTPLDRLLTNLGVKHCLVAGGTTRGGLADTVRTGAPLGYEMFVVEDAAFPNDSWFLHRLEVRAEFITTDEVVTLAASQGVVAQEAEQSDRAALILVDLQNDFLHVDGVMRRCGYSPLTDQDVERVMDNNRALVAAMRARGWPVIFAKVGQRADGLDRATDDVVTHRRRPLLQESNFMQRGTWGSQLVDGLEPGLEDFVLEKPGHSAFGFTPLHRILRNLGVKRCLVTGGATTGCVSDTVREGLGLGYEVTVVLDATYPPESPYLEALATVADVCATTEAVAGLAPDP